MQLRRASVSSLASLTIFPWAVSNSFGFDSKVDGREEKSPKTLLVRTSGDRGDVGGDPKM